MILQPAELVEPVEPVENSRRLNEKHSFEKCMADIES